MTGSCSRCLVVLLFLGCSTPAFAAPATQKASAAARDHSISIINDAIKMLSGEYEAHQKDATKPLREKANYFIENPAADMSTTVLLDATGRNYGSTPETCYIRWQLLSFFDPSADKDKLTKLATQIAMLYSRAPAPLPHPSLIPGIRSALDRQAAQTRADDVNQLNDLWNQKVAQWVADNNQIVNYNDALYALLPDDLMKFRLGWLDYFDRRIPAGLSVAEPFTKMLSAIGSWDVTATPGDRQVLTQTIARTETRFSNDYPPKPYGQAEVDETSHRVKFQPAVVKNPNKKQLEDLAKAVAAGTPPPGTLPPGTPPPGTPPLGGKPAAGK